VRQHGEPAERLRVQLLVRDEVRDDVLDVVGHHREQVRRDEHPKAGVLERAIHGRYSRASSS
jgi:hypothetical protein